MKFVQSSAVGLVIPTYNDHDHLATTLELLRGMSLDEAIVVVVDDGSQDQTAGLLAATEDIVALEGTGDLWWSGAINLGARELIHRGAEVIVMWNDDNVAASPDCLTELVRHVRATDDCASPVLLQRSETTGVTTFHRGGETDWLAGGLRLRGYGQAHTSSDVVETVEWLPGSALTLSAARFVSLDGVDQVRFPQYRGDADLSMRAIEQGATCVVLNWCWVENDRGRTGVQPTRRAGPRQFIKGLTSIRSSDHVVSMVRFVFRHCPRRTLAVWCLFVYYLKYTYWCIKTWRP
jgi:GT2 family glycosyltransferase